MRWQQADLDAVGLRPGDVVLCVSASGSTPYTLDDRPRGESAGRHGRRACQCRRTARCCDCADIPVLLDTGPEVVAGSTRMGAATAQKIALNMLSVLVGLQLGHVHEGYMVNVVADNAKLIDRAARIVAALVGMRTAARQPRRLARTGGAVKPAVLDCRRCHAGRGRGRP